MSIEDIRVEIPASVTYLGRIHDDSTGSWELLLE